MQPRPGAETVRPERPRERRCIVSTPERTAPIWRSGPPPISCTARHEPMSQLTNGPRRPLRPRGLRGRGPAPQLPARRGRARPVALGAQPCRARAGGADGPAAPQPHHPQRRPDRGRRRPTGAARPRPRRHRAGCGGGARVRLAAHRDLAAQRAAQRLPAGPDAAALPLPDPPSGDPRRGGERRRPYRHRRRGLRCRDPLRRATRPRHGGGAGLRAAAFRRCRRARLPGAPGRSGGAGRSGRPCLPAPALSRRQPVSVGTGVRSRRGNRGGRRPADPRRPGPGPARRSRRARDRLRLRGIRRRRPRVGLPGAAALAVVPGLPGFHLYYPGRRQVPAPLRAFLDVVREAGRSAPSGAGPASPPCP